MRGKDQVEQTKNTSLRITPAHAGKRIFGPGYLTFGKDHPRACGEKDLSKNFILPELGSPPRMRGKVYCDKV